MSYTKYISTYCDNVLWRNAKDIYFWPRLLDDIKQKWSKCEKCCDFKKYSSQSKVIIPLELQEFNTGDTWSCNIMTFNGKDILVAVDRVTSFAWILIFHRKGAKNVAAVLKHWIFMWLVPTILRTAREFAHIAKKICTYHFFTCVYSPQSIRYSKHIIPELKNLIKREVITGIICWDLWSLHPIQGTVGHCTRCWGEQQMDTWPTRPTQPLTSGRASESVTRMLT